jgi:hypothetical protein
MRDVALITTHNRVALCEEAVKRFKALNFVVVVVEDPLPESQTQPDYSSVRELADVFVQMPAHHGRKGYCAVVTAGLQAARTLRPSKVWFVQDDNWVTEELVQSAQDLWSKLPRRKKGALVLFTPEGAHSSLSPSPWSGRTMVALDGVDGLLECHYIDNSAIFSAPLLNALGWALEPMPASWWGSDESSKSSGYGAQMTRRALADGFRLYRSTEPLCETVVCRSEMHPEERTKVSMLAVSATRYLSPVVVSMASLKNRLHILPRVLDSLKGQADRIHVHANDYGPEDVPQSCRELATWSFGPDLTDTGKFNVPDLPEDCYHLTVDDDIKYPPNYVSKLVGQVEARERKALICVHGRVAPRKGSRYYSGTGRAYHFEDRLWQPVRVDIPGTGTLAYHRQTISFPLEIFTTPRMTDVWVGLRAKQQAVPVVAVERPVQWLREIREQPSTIFRTALRDSSAIDAVIEGNRPWPVSDAARVADPLRGAPRSEVAAVSIREQVRTRGKSAALFPKWDVAQWRTARVPLERTLRPLLQSLDLSRVLDFGCGWGRWEPFLLECGATHIEGVDISAEMLALAPSSRRTLRSSGDSLPAASTVFIFDVLRFMVAADIKQLWTQLRGVDVVLVEGVGKGLWGKESELRDVVAASPSARIPIHGIEVLLFSFKPT